MPRAARKDEKVSRLLYANGFLKDRRSFVGHGSDYVPHLYLHGEDVVAQRGRAFSRAQGRCEARYEIVAGKRKVKRRCDTPAYELDHIQGGTCGRCDCLHNLQILCTPCHRLKHGREIQSAKVAELQ